MKGARYNRVRRATAVWVCVCVSMLSGCAYHFGNGFDKKITSICIPVFESDVRRRGLEEQLTEAVQKQVQMRTPYRLTSEGEADTLLTGKIVSVRKNVLGENQYDDPRELQLSLAVDVTWRDLRTERVIAEQRYLLPNDAANFTAQAEFAPEVGQSLATATSQAMDRMARDIVNMMETPDWYSPKGK